MASDAFPFRDGIDAAAAVRRELRPARRFYPPRRRGDCRRRRIHGIAMIFTDMRHFRHNCGADDESFSHW